MTLINLKPGWSRPSNRWRHILTAPVRCWRWQSPSMTETASSLGAKGWAAPLQDALRQRYHGAFLSLASLYLEQGKVRRALATFQHLLIQNKYVEEAHRGVIQCYVQLQDMGRAADHYQYLCAMLKEELGASPSP
jgi:DNA-binding SARP family transcriptional activator